MDLVSVAQLSTQKFEVTVRGHKFTSDMSREEGGSDEGPRPTELLIGAFGACIGMAVSRYLQTIQFDGKISVYLTYQLADRPKRVSNIVIDLELPDEFPENRVSAVYKVIESCPVHGTLNNPPQIDVEIG